MRQIDTIHFQSMRNSQICMIGCDIRTEGGFPHERLLFASRQYRLKEREARLLFGIPQRYPVGSCSVVITTGFFVGVVWNSHLSVRRRHFSSHPRFHFGRANASLSAIRVDPVSHYSASRLVEGHGRREGVRLFSLKHTPSDLQV